MFEIKKIFLNSTRKYVVDVQRENEKIKECTQSLLKKLPWLIVNVGYLLALFLFSLEIKVEGKNCQVIQVFMTFILCYFY